MFSFYGYSWIRIFKQRNLYQAHGRALKVARDSKTPIEYIGKGPKNQLSSSQLN